MLPSADQLCNPSNSPFFRNFLVSASQSGETLLHDSGLGVEWELVVKPLIDWERLGSLIEKLVRLSSVEKGVGIGLETCGTFEGVQYRLPILELNRSLPEKQPGLCQQRALGKARRKIKQLILTLLEFLKLKVNRGEVKHNIVLNRRNRTARLF